MKGAGKIMGIGTQNHNPLTMKGHQKIREAAITLTGCLEVIRELAETGEQEPSVKLALFAAALSPQKKLALNGKQTRVMAAFVHDKLPSRDKLRAWLTGKGKGYVTDNQLDSLYAIEAAEQSGTLPDCPQDDWSLEDWQAWAADCERLHGIGQKTARFAGLLLRPLSCPLCPVDTWVMTRLGYDHDTPRNRTEYLDIERLVLEERDRNGHSDLPLGAWHWFKWSEIRQECGAEKLSERPESHKDLSPAWY